VLIISPERGSGFTIFEPYVISRVLGVVGSVDSGDGGEEWLSVRLNKSMRNGSWSESEESGESKAHVAPQDE
jgi:hypothetical protein